MTFFSKRFVCVFIGAILIVYVFCIGIKNIFRYNRYRVEYNSLMDEYRFETLKHDDYRQKVEEMKTTPFWEFHARKRLNYVYSGEVVYNFIVSIE